MLILPGQLLAKVIFSSTVLSPVLIYGMDAIAHGAAVGSTVNAS